MAAEGETSHSWWPILHKSVAAIATQLIFTAWTHPPANASSQSQWGRLLGSSRTLFPGGLVAPFCRSPCSEIARLKPRPWPWPFMDPRCHLQMSPFRMSWMCCTMRLMATGKWQMKNLLSICNTWKIIVIREKTYPYCQLLLEWWHLHTS